MAMVKVSWNLCFIQTAIEATSFVTEVKAPRKCFVFRNVLSVQCSVLLGSGLLCDCFFGESRGNGETAIL